MSPGVPPTVGRYEVIRPLGQGGMGAIYLARDPKIGDRLVVLKVLREGFDTPEMRERFTLEANAAGALRHPNIVTIFDVGEYDGQPFIAMEYIQGETLTELITRRADLPPGRKLQLMEQLCAGLHYAHKAGIVHRDIKPANIMIDGEGLLKIVDFGVAHLRAVSGVTRTGTIIGTLNYMAPEQLAGKRVDARADVFSFGAVLYEMLSYRRAFPGDFPSIVQSILSANFEPLAVSMPDLDPSLGKIVDHCLAKEPGDRIADLETVRHQLAALRQRMAIDESEAPTMSSPVTRPRPAGQRELRAAASVAVILGLAFVGWTWMQSGARQAVDRRVADLLPETPVATTPGPVQPAAAEPGRAGFSELPSGSVAGDVSSPADAAVRSQPATRGRSEPGSIPIEVQTGSPELGNAVPPQTAPGESSSARSADLADRYARAQAALDMGDLATAISILESIQRDDPNYRDVTALLTRARREQSVQAMRAFENGLRLESAGDLIGAMEEFQRARRIDPSLAQEASEAINRVRARMTREGTEAFVRARDFESLGLVERAIAEYDRAFRLLADDDPNKLMAKNRLDALRARR